VVAIALDTSALDEPHARRAIEVTAAHANVFVDDPVRNGGGAIWRSVEQALRVTTKAMLAMRAQ
jgi:uncharacterized NAD-dependent epimerase/dehydratase family protein